MHTLTDDELLREPKVLLDDARLGQLTVVTTSGQPLVLAVPLSADRPLQEGLIELAAQLYAQERISLERAAHIAGLSSSETIDEFGRRGIATIRLAPGDLERELAAIGH